jgi:AhpD family alkylhydroperoxidase
MDYAVISKETIGHLYNGYSSIKNSPLPQSLRALLELRVSQINGCNYCCNLHKTEAIKLGVDEDKINHLEQFLDSPYFSDVEKEALSWAELLTSLKTKPSVKTTKLHLYFSEREIVDITICISLMNAFNRLAISMRDELR